MYEIGRFDALPRWGVDAPETKGAPVGGPLKESGGYLLPAGGGVGFGISLRGNLSSRIAAW
jgi:hypothetical protein